MLVGCSSTKQSNLSIDKALESLGKGLAGMKVAELDQLTNQCFVSRGETNTFVTGLFVSDATVVFNVTASKSNSNELALDLSASVPQIPVSGSVSDTYSSASSINRGNQIAIHFVSPLFTTTTTTTTTPSADSTTSTNSATDTSSKPSTGPSASNGTGGNAGKQTTGTVVTVITQGITNPQTLASWFDVVYTNSFCGNSVTSESNGPVPYFKQ